MKKLKLIGLGLAGVVSFIFFMVNVLDMYQSFKAGTTEDISGQTMLTALVSFIVAGICGGFFEGIRLSLEKEKSIPVLEKNIKSSRSINEGKLLGGILLLGSGLLEYFTRYISINYLIPIQDTELLRNIFSSAIFPVVIGIWGLSMIYGGIKPLLDKKTP